MSFAFSDDIILGAAEFDQFGCLHGGGGELSGEGWEVEVVDNWLGGREERRENATKCAFLERDSSKRRRHGKRRKKVKRKS